MHGSSEGEGNPVNSLFNNFGVLPPFEGSPADPMDFTPYRWTSGDLVRRMGFSPERIKLLSHLMEYRRALRVEGVQGLQWLDGSFLEDAERLKGRAPNDIDVMNLVLHDPQITPSHSAWPLLTDRPALKSTYHLDVMEPIALYVDPTGRHAVCLETFTYFFSLFSHTRMDHFGFPVWKGMIELELSSNVSEDDEAFSIIASGVAP